MSNEEQFCPLIQGLCKTKGCGWWDNIYEICAVLLQTMNATSRKERFIHISNMRNPFMIKAIKSKEADEE
jgi:hypothetical protein